MKFIIEERSFNYFDQFNAETISYKEAQVISILDWLGENEQTALDNRIQQWRVTYYPKRITSYEKISEPEFMGGRVREGDGYRPYQAYNAELTIKEEVRVIELDSLEALHQLSLRLDYPIIINYNDHSGKYPYPFLLVYDDYLE